MDYELDDDGGGRMPRRGLARSTSMLSSEAQTQISSILARSGKLTFDDIQEDLIVRMFLDTLRGSKRPQVNHQILRTIAEMKGMLKAKSPGSSDSVEEALNRLRKT